MAWPQEPQELLAGARGRRLCFEIVNPRLADVPVGIAPAWRELLLRGSTEASPQQLAAELGSLVAAADLATAFAATTQTGLFEALRASVDAARYWQPSDECDQALAWPEVAEELGPVARAVTARPAAAWWDSPIARDSQQFVAALDRDWAPADADAGPALSGTADRLAAWRVSTLEDERGAADKPADPAAPYSGHWWSSPAASGFVATSRSLPGLPSVGLELVEDAAGWREVAGWPLVPAAAARVYEIRGPQDWARLATRYPLDVSMSRRHDWWRVTGLAGSWIIPDYAAVAADYDAVHLTIGGYLTTAGRAMALGDEEPGGWVRLAGGAGQAGEVLSAGAGQAQASARTMLAGWNPDETYWLADVLTSAGPPVRWLNPGHEPFGWERAG
jgi:hypothetical protein